MRAVISGYAIDDQTVYESTQTVILSGARLIDQTPVIIKLLKDEHPSPNEISRMRQEYAFTKDFDSTHLVHSYALEKYQNSLAIVLEKIEGITLARLLAEKKKLSVREFLEWALLITEGLEEIHHRNIVHNDINPTNIMVNSEKKEAKIIDFNLATSLPKNWVPIISPHLLQGTLSYLSPEQTGRMNRGIDYRTDFYSLGITFYQMLTGALPFQTSDPLELIHCHIALLPKPPHLVDPSIPDVVSAIVMKLLAKKAEDRYQNAKGLFYDLKNCLNQLATTELISSFPIGTKDLFYFFQIPEILYGRTKEVDILLSAYERVRKGAIELMLVKGYSGIGKSSLVHEIHKPVIESHGYYVSGKFEQFKHTIPYGAFVEALSELIDQILTESEEKITLVRQKILTALKGQGQIIIDVVPNLMLIIGEQLPVSALESDASQSRFSFTFQNLIKALATAENPLTIFLDDLQWADVPSLKLLETLRSNFECHYLFMIGAYRSNEITIVHPLMRMIENLEKETIFCESVDLGPLEQSHIGELLADTLHQVREEVIPLAQLCYEKTKGNPFFLKQLLQQLYKEQLIEFNFKENRWSWDLDKIREKKMTDNVVDLMIEKIGQLSPNGQFVIKMASCIGSQFSMETLCSLCDQDFNEVLDALQEIMKESFILRNTTNTQFNVYQFAHDRIQQAAYQLVSQEEKKIAHITIARLLLKKIPSEKLFSSQLNLTLDVVKKQELTDTLSHTDAGLNKNEQLFDLVNHFNFGLDYDVSNTLNLSLAERKKMGELNRQAAHMANSAAAYEPALKYSHYNLKCLGTDWESDRSLMFESHALMVETAFLNANIALMDKHADIALKLAHDVFEEYKINRIKIYNYYSQLKFREGQMIALSTLERLGVNIPRNPQKMDVLLAMLKTKFLLFGKKISQLYDLPEMTDPIQCLIMEVLIGSYYTISQTNPLLLPIFTCITVNLSLKYGNAKESPIAYSGYGIICCCTSISTIEQGYQFGNLGLKLVDRTDDKQMKTRVAFSNYIVLQLWKLSFKKAAYYLFENYERGLLCGQLLYARLSLCYSYEYNLLAGGSIKELIAKMNVHKAELRNRDLNNYINLSLIHQTALNLSEEVARPSYLMGKDYDETVMLPIHLAKTEGPILSLVYWHKLYLSLLFDDPKESLRCIEKYEQVEKDFRVILASPFTPIYHSLKSIVLINTYPSATPKEKKVIKSTLLKERKKLKEWASIAKKNHLHRYYLVEAEWAAKVLNKPEIALDFYEKAITHAHEYELINDEALANELVAKFYLSQGEEKIAKLYMEDAYHCYLLWGADAKVKQLEKKYGLLMGMKQPYYTASMQTTFHSTMISTHTTYTAGLYSDRHQTLNLDNAKAPELTDRKSPNINNMGELTIDQPRELSRSLNSKFDAGRSIDVGRILELSQTISSTVHLTDLLEKIMKLVIENTGAQKSYLLLAKEEKFYIEAKVAPDQGKEILQSIEISDEVIPTSVVNYVARTKESVFLEDAANLNRFNDPYLSQTQTKSILCMPLLNQGNLSGILYLENSLNKSFSKNQIDLLNLLASQIAISLDNARLYESTRELNAHLMALNHSYERLVPRDFLTLLERQSITDVTLGDHIEKEMTVLFTDIRDFTSLSEKMTPEKNFIFINSFLKVMAPLIRKHGGFIDKYIGDAIMALFPHNADDALRCAIEMRQALEEYNDNNTQDAVDIGIGINTGIVMLGTVGEQNRFGVTAISDIVTDAMQVESLTKTYKEKILITEATFKNLLIPEDYEIEMIGRTTVTGRTKEITLYKVREIHSKNYQASR